MTEIWTSVWNASADEIERQAEQAETAGFDGMFVTDSQNLWLECWVALTVAAKATSRLMLGPGVTNPVTRHPAVTADAAASLQEVAKRRVVLGIGRGDSSLAYLGYGPAPLPRFAEYLRQLQAYLRGEQVGFGSGEDTGLPGLGSLGYARQPAASKIRWLPGIQPKVPVDVADVDARTRAEFEAARSEYDMTRHGETGTSQAAAVSDDLIDRFGIAGPPDYCVERLRQVRNLGFDRLMFHTRIRGASPAEQDVTTAMLINEVLPGLRAS